MGGRACRFPVPHPCDADLLAPIRQAQRATRTARPAAVERLAPNDPLWATWFALAGVGERPEPRRGVTLDNQSQEASAVEGGFGIALMTPLFWRAELDSGRLVRPFDQFLLGSPPPISSGGHSERRVGIRKIERFREWIREELSRSAA